MVSTEKILHLRTIKKEYITAEKLNRFRAKIPDGERRIGSLPYDWIKRIEKDKISDITRSACDVFEKFSIEIEDISNRYTGKVDKLENLKQAQSALLQSLQKILKRDDIDITNVGSGSLKHCQRLDVGKYSFPSQGGTYYTKSGNKFSQNSSGTPVDGLTYYALTTSASGTTGAVQVKAETTTIGGGSTTAANYITRSDMANIWVEENGQVRKAELSDFETDSSQPNILKLKSGVKYIQQSDAANAKTYSVKGDIDGVTVGDKGVHRLTEEEKQTYGDAIANSGLQDAQGNPYDADDFYMYYDNKNNAVFVLISDVDDGNNNATTYSYVANGEYTKNTTYDDVQLTFDPTNGRITQIAIPTYAADGTVSSWTAISVSAETVTDDAAYEDAYNKYEYDTYLYDQKNKEINAKTEVIQQEDKNLELKLQRLDNERTQITTEIEGVKYYVKKNSFILFYT